MKRMIAKCNDTRKCCFRNEFNACTILTETYQCNGECNFAKAKRSDLAYNHAKRIEEKS